MPMGLLLNIGAIEPDVLERVIVQGRQQMALLMQQLPTRDRMEQPGKRPFMQPHETFLTFHLLALQWG